MKALLFFSCLFLALSVSAQRDFSLSALANFDFAATGFGTNDAGIGFTLSQGFFTRSRLQLKAELSLDHFVGNKLGYSDGSGNVVGYNPTVLSGKVGPEFFLIERVSIAALYGVSTFETLSQRTTSGAINAELTTYVGRRKKGALAFTYSAISGSYPAVHFFGLRAGYRIL